MNYPTFTQVSPDEVTSFNWLCEPVINSLKIQVNFTFSIRIYYIVLSLLCEMLTNTILSSEELLFAFKIVILGKTSSRGKNRWVPFRLEKYGEDIFDFVVYKHILKRDICLLRDVGENHQQ